MATGSGLAKQIGFADEVTFGTYVAPTRAVPLVEESMSKDVARLESNAVIANQRVIRSQQWSPGNITCGGDIGLELYDKSIGLLLQWMFGTIVTAGAGPFTHTATPGDMSDDFFTMQIGRPDVSGVVQPFSYLGCMVDSWEIACVAGEIATLGLTVVAQDEVTSEGLVAASYATGIRPMTFIGGSATVAAASVPIKSGRIAGNNGLNQNRRFWGDGKIRQPIEAAKRVYDGSLMVEFDGLAQYNRFINANEVALVLTLAAGAQTLVLTANVRFDGRTPKTSGTDITEHEIPFKCIGATADSGAIAAVFTTTEATP